MQAQQLSMILNIVLFIALAVLIGFGVTKGNFDGVDKKTLEDKYITLEKYYELEDKYGSLKDETYEKDNTIFDLKQRLKKQDDSPKKQDGSGQKECAFEDLTPRVQESFVSKEKFDTLQTKLQKAEKTQKNVSESAGASQKSPKEVTFTCDDELEGDFFITKSCKQRLDAFLEQLDKSYDYRVVGLVDKKDFDIVKALREADSDKLRKYGITAYQVKQIARIAPLGLARARAKEAMQYLKATFGKDASVSQASYELVLEDKRGFVVKAVK
ncbi:MAG: hypothetical protein ACQERK_02380 [Campylobacterota bacterium]